MFLAAKLFNESGMLAQASCTLGSHGSQLGGTLPKGIGNSSKAIYYDESIPQLQTLLVQATRAKPNGIPEVFIPPAGTHQTSADYNHIVFGQRGSGKSSLLRYLESECRSRNRISAWIDVEDFTDLEYPDVLISCVLAVVTGVSDSLAREGKFSVKWRSWFRAENGDLKRQLERIEGNLKVLKFAQQNEEIQWTHKEVTGSQLDMLGSLKAQGGVEGSAGVHKRNSREVTKEHKVSTNKGEYLERSLSDFKEVLRAASAELNGGFVFVDDLYLISGSDQPKVLGYLHRLLKDTELWLKIGSIRSATNNYISADPPVGMQIRHDMQEVALDQQFSFVGTTTAFLEEILGQIANSLAVDYTVLFNDGARVRLMLASGGVARDYLLLAHDSIEVARDHGPGKKSGSDRVSVEDVNSAAGKIAPSKLDDLQKDAPDAAEAIQSRVIDLTNFCRDRKSGFFLIDIGNRDLMRDMNALQNLRFAHLLFRSETIPDRQSERFNVYLLDLAQLSYQRAMEGVNFDWADRENRRARKLVYSPSWNSSRANRSGSAESNDRTNLAQKVDVTPSMFDEDHEQ